MLNPDIPEIYHGSDITPCYGIQNTLYSTKPLNRHFWKQWRPKWLCCISSGSTLFVKVKKRSSDKRIQYFFENYNPTPLDVISPWFHGIVRGRSNCCPSVLLNLLYLLQRKKWQYFSYSRWLRQKQDDLDLQCFQKSINLSSAGYGLMHSFWKHPSSEFIYWYKITKLPVFRSVTLVFCCSKVSKFLTLENFVFFLSQF